MPLISHPRPGRRLMVLDDAETIARQARRRAAMHRRRVEALQQIAGVSVVLAVVAVILGVSPLIVGLVAVAFGAVLGVLYHRIRERQQQMRRWRSRATPGSGIGTPRPKGGFSTTRHRSGAPVWINDHAA